MSENNLKISDVDLGSIQSLFDPQNYKQYFGGNRRYLNYNQLRARALEYNAWLKNAAQSSAQYASFSESLVQLFSYDDSGIEFADSDSEKRDLQKQWRDALFSANGQTGYFMATFMPLVVNRQKQIFVGDEMTSNETILLDALALEKTYHYIAFLCDYILTDQIGAQAKFARIVSETAHEFLQTKVNQQSLLPTPPSMFTAEFSDVECAEPVTDPSVVALIYKNLSTDMYRLFYAYDDAMGAFLPESMKRSCFLLIKTAAFAAALWISLSAQSRAELLPRFRFIYADLAILLGLKLAAVDIATTTDTSPYVQKPVTLIPEMIEGVDDTLDEERLTAAVYALHRAYRSSKTIFADSGSYNAEEIDVLTNQLRGRIEDEYKASAETIFAEDSDYDSFDDGWKQIDSSDDESDDAMDVDNPAAVPAKKASSSENEEDSFLADSDEDDDNGGGGDKNGDKNGEDDEDDDGFETIEAILYMVSDKNVNYDDTKSGEVSFDIDLDDVKGILREKFRPDLQGRSLAAAVDMHPERVIDNLVKADSYTEAFCVDTSQVFTRHVVTAVDEGSKLPLGSLSLGKLAGSALCLPQNYMIPVRNSSYEDAVQKESQRIEFPFSVQTGIYPSALLARLCNTIEGAKLETYGAAEFVTQRKQGEDTVKESELALSASEFLSAVANPSPKLLYGLRFSAVIDAAVNSQGNDKWKQYFENLSEIADGTAVPSTEESIFHIWLAESIGAFVLLFKLCETKSQEGDKVSFEQEASEGRILFEAMKKAWGIKFGQGNLPSLYLPCYMLPGNTKFARLLMSLLRDPNSRWHAWFAKRYKRFVDANFAANAVLYKIEKSSVPNLTQDMVDLSLEVDRLTMRFPWLPSVFNSAETSEQFDVFLEFLGTEIIAVAKKFDDSRLKPDDILNSFDALDNNFVRIAPDGVVAERAERLRKEMLGTSTTMEFPSPFTMQSISGTRNLDLSGAAIKTIYRLVKSAFVSQKSHFNLAFPQNRITVDALIATVKNLANAVQIPKTSKMLRLAPEELRSMIPHCAKLQYMVYRMKSSSDIFATHLFETNNAPYSYHVPSYIEFNASMATITFERIIQRALDILSVYQMALRSAKAAFVDTELWRMQTHFISRFWCSVYMAFAALVKALHIVENTFQPGPLFSLYNKIRGILESEWITIDERTVTLVGFINHLATDLGLIGLHLEITNEMIPLITESVNRFENAGFVTQASIALVSGNGEQLKGRDKEHAQAVIHYAQHVQSRWFDKIPAEVGFALVPESQVPPRMLVSNSQTRWGGSMMEKKLVSTEDAEKVVQKGTPMSPKTDLRLFCDGVCLAMKTPTHFGLFREILTSTPTLEYFERSNLVTEHCQRVLGALSRVMGQNNIKGDNSLLLVAFAIRLMLLAIATRRRDSPDEKTSIDLTKRESKSSKKKKNEEDAMDVSPTNSLFELRGPKAGGGNSKPKGKRKAEQMSAPENGDQDAPAPDAKPPKEKKPKLPDLSIFTKYQQAVACAFNSEPKAFEKYGTYTSIITITGMQAMINQLPPRARQIYDVFAKVDSTDTVQVAAAATLVGWTASEESITTIRDEVHAARNLVLPDPSYEKLEKELVDTWIKSAAVYSKASEGYADKILDLLSKMDFYNLTGLGQELCMAILDAQFQPFLYEGSVEQLMRAVQVIGKHFQAQNAATPLVKEWADKVQSLAKTATESWAPVTTAIYSIAFDIYDGCFPSPDAVVNYGFSATELRESAQSRTLIGELSLKQYLSGSKLIMEALYHQNIFKEYLVRDARYGYPVIRLAVPAVSLLAMSEALFLLSGVVTKVVIAAYDVKAAENYVADNIRPIFSTSEFDFLPITLEEEEKAISAYFAKNADVEKSKTTLFIAWDLGSTFSSTARYSLWNKSHLTKRAGHLGEYALKEMQNTFAGMKFNSRASSQNAAKLRSAKAKARRVAARAKQVESEASAARTEVSELRERIREYRKLYERPGYGAELTRKAGEVLSSLRKAAAYVPQKAAVIGDIVNSIGNWFRRNPPAAPPQVAPAVQPQVPVVQPQAPPGQPQLPVVQPQVPPAQPQAPQAPVIQPQVPQAPVIQPQVPQAPVIQPQVPQAPVIQPQVPQAPVIQPQVPQAPQVPVAIQPNVPAAPVTNQPVVQKPAGKRKRNTFSKAPNRAQNAPIAYTGSNSSNQPGPITVQLALDDDDDDDELPPQLAQIETKLKVKEKEFNDIVQNKIAVDPGKKKNLIVTKGWEIMGLLGKATPYVKAAAAVALVGTAAAIANYLYASTGTNTLPSDNLSPYGMSMLPNVSDMEPANFSLRVPFDTSMTSNTSFAQPSLYETSTAANTSFAQPFSSETYPAPGMSFPTAPPPPAFETSILPNTSSVEPTNPLPSLNQPDPEPVPVSANGKPFYSNWFAKQATGLL